MKTNIKIVIGVAIGILISVGSCYALAENLINSKDVVYEDNSNLLADNVQEAIDGTCSKIDTRLSDIEDKLYTVKKINGSIEFTSNTTLSYTGTSIEFPTKSYCSVTVYGSWSTGYPTALMITDSSAAGGTRLASNTVGQPDTSSTVPNDLNWSISSTYSTYVGTKTTVYVWAKYAGVGVNWIHYDGFCATKYKQ